MTDKQQRFIEEYLIDCNATQAAIRAGYSEKTAYSIGQRLLRNVEVRTRIEKRQDELSQKTNINQEWIMNKLEECVYKSMNAEELKTWDYESKSLVGTGNFVYDSRGATKALELLGKQIGMFKERLELSGEVVVFQGDDKLED